MGRAIASKVFATHLRFSFDETQVPLPVLGFPSDSLQKKNDTLVWQIETRSENQKPLPPNQSGKIVQ